MKGQVADDAVQDTQPSNAAHWHSDYFKLGEFENGRSREITLTSSLPLPFFIKTGYKILR